MHKYLLYAFSHSNVSAAFSCISRGATARKRFTLSLMDLLSSRVMEVIFEIIRRSINLLCVLSLKLKSLRLRSLRGYSWSTWIRKTLKMGYKHGVFFPLLRCGPWYGEMHLENTSEPKVTLPEAVFGEAAEQDGQVTRTGIRQILKSLRHHCSASPGLDSSCFMSPPQLPDISAPTSLLLGKSREVWFSKIHYPSPYEHVMGTRCSEHHLGCSSWEENPHLSRRIQAGCCQEQWTGCTFTFALCSGCW